jgi:hypothetical protein
MMPSHDLTRYRYVLVHASDDEIAGVAVLAMAPEARLAFHEGEWTLLESTLPLVPLDAPDAPLPVPAPRTFGERFLEVIGRVERLPPGKRGLPFEGAAEGPK